MMKIKRMKRIVSLLTISMVLITTGSLMAQEVSNSIGVRYGHGGISYKYMEDYHQGFEAILTFRDNGIQFIGLVQEYQPIKTDRINNLYLYYGAGGHVGYKGVSKTYARNDGNGCYLYSDTRYNPVIGLDGIVGGEYKFYSVPLTLSLDYKPFIEFFGQDMVRLDLWDFGLTLRYTL
jgi:hypothetical protein